MTELTLTPAAVGSLSLSLGSSTALTLLRDADWTVFNVLSYGAVGDGVTDDTAAITAAFAACAGDGFVYFPARTYKVTDEFTVPGGCVVAGAGYNSVIRQYAREKNVFVVGGNDVVISGLRLQGDAGTTGVLFTKNNGIYANGYRNLTVEGCWLHAFEAAAIQIGDCSNYRVEKNLCYDAPVASAFALTNGDIMVYSSAAGARGIIRGNFCLSNNKAGIYANALGKDSDIIIDGNVCVALTSAWAEVADANVVRAWGIIVTYNGGNRARNIVTSNICRIANNGGIYITGDNVTGGPFVIANNSVSHVSLTGTTLQGGIYCNNADQSTVISGNTIDDIPNEAGIKISYATATVGRHLVLGNILRACSRGIYVTGSGMNVDIISNHVSASIGKDIVVQNGAGSTFGQIQILSNRCHRTNDGHAILVDAASSTQPTMLKDNYLKGFSTTTGDTNVGIYVRTHHYTVKDNYVDTFGYGIYVEEAIVGRQPTVPQLDNNHVRNCDIGIVFTGATSAVCLVEGNVFVGSLTADLGGNPGRIGRRQGTRIIGEGTAAPTTGTWIVGDRVENTVPVAGGTVGWICTTGGNPGVWKTYGAIAA